MTINVVGKTLNHLRSFGWVSSHCTTLRLAAPCHLFQEAAWRTGPVTLPSLRVLMLSQNAKYFAIKRLIIEQKTSQYAIFAFKEVCAACVRRYKSLKLLLSPPRPSRNKRAMTPFSVKTTTLGKPERRGFNPLRSAPLPLKGF